MKISHDGNKMSRGVTQLAYMGDAAIDSTKRRDIAMTVIGGLAAVYAGGLLQLVGLGVAGYGAHRLIKK